MLLSKIGNEFIHFILIFKLFFKTNYFFRVFKVKNNPGLPLKFQNQTLGYLRVFLPISLGQNDKFSLNFNTFLGFFIKKLGLWTQVELA